MKIIRVLILISFALLLIPQLSMAQGARKSAYVDSIKVINNYYKTKEADEELGKEGKKKTAERDKYVKKINKLRDEIELLSKGSREKKEAELNNEVRALQDFDREATLAMRRKGDDRRREILKDIDEKIRVYGKEKGYDIIFDSRTLIYADEALDITDEVIGIINKGK